MKEGGGGQKTTQALKVIFYFGSAVKNKDTHTNSEGKKKMRAPSM